MKARRSALGLWSLVDAETGELVTTLPGLLAEEGTLAAMLAGAVDDIGEEEHMDEREMERTIERAHAIVQGPRADEVRVTESPAVHCQQVTMPHSGSGVWRYERDGHEVWDGEPMAGAFKVANILPDFYRSIQGRLATMSERDADSIGALIAAAPETAAERDRLAAENARLREDCDRATTALCERIIENARRRDALAELVEAATLVDREYGKVYLTVGAALSDAIDEDLRAAIAKAQEVES